MSNLKISRKCSISRETCRDFGERMRIKEISLIDTTNLDTYKPHPVPLPFNVTLSATQRNLL